MVVRRILVLNQGSVQSLLFHATMPLMREYVIKAILFLVVGSLLLDGIRDALLSAASNSPAKTALVVGMNIAGILGLFIFLTSFSGKHK